MTICADGKLRFFHLDEQRWEEFGLPDKMINDVCVSPDATWMAICGLFSGVAIVDVAKKSVTRHLDVPGGSGLMLALSRDGERLAVPNIWGGRVGVQPADRRTADEAKPVSEVRMGCRAESRWLAVFGGVRLRLAGRRRCLRRGLVDVRRTRRPGANGDVRFHCETAATTERTTVRIFDVGRIPGRLTLPHASTVIGVDVSPDGTLVATTARDGLTRVFDVHSGAVLMTFARHGLTPLNVAFLSSQELIVAFQEGTIALVDVRSGAEHRSVSTSPIETNAEVRMTSDRRWLVVSLFHAIVRVLDPSDGGEAAVDDQERARIIADLEQQTGLVSPRGRIENPAGQSPFIDRDGTSIYLRTPSTRSSRRRSRRMDRSSPAPRSTAPRFRSSTRWTELIATLRLSHQSNDTRFSRNGRTIVARWLNAVSAVRYPEAEELVELARRQVYRNLTASERTEFGLPAAEG